ncbi:MAG: ABC transporter ATP-binding protein [Burkholderiaceae bacterium]|jgi:ABC-type multidrug transport system fused ATPase/permease subunit|nr:ABC transporter ATP-binding protein [Burkholderiaceae bacterium]
MDSNEKNLENTISIGIKANLVRLWDQITAKRRIQLLFIFALTLLTSAVEVISLGSVAPFLIALSSPQEFQSYPIITWVTAYLKIDDPIQLALLFAVLFGIASLVAGSMRLILQWYSVNICHSIGADFSIKIYEGALYQPYLKHIHRNSSEIISGLTKSNSLVTGILQPILSLLSALPVLILIILALIYANALIAFITIFLLIFIYAIIIKLVYRKLAIDSNVVAREQQATLKFVQEGLGGIRDVIIDSSQKLHLSHYATSTIRYQKSLASIFIVCNIPRYGIEMFGMVLISISTFIIALTDGGIKNAIPMLGFMALSAQRFLPLLQQSYSAIMTIKGSSVSVGESLNLLEESEKYTVRNEYIAPISFNNSILFDGINFRYNQNSKNILNQLSVEIQKGKKIGIIGESGVGKSTFLDLFMGLISPDSGGIYVDGILITDKNRKAWQKRIAHVPQNIFLLDGTIIENIAFGVPNQNIDMGRVIDAAKRANIAELIESWPCKYQSTVGERGSKLSGGQKQRIAISRALYKKADILIFDEATSALDADTERDLMQSIFSLDDDMTKIIVSHRPASLKGVDVLLSFQNGKLINAIESS